MKLELDIYIERYLVWFLLLALPLTMVFAAETNNAANNAATGNTINEMMTALQKNLPSVVRLIIAIGYVMGLWLIYSALYTLKIYGDSRTMMSSNVSFATPLFKLLLGVLLLLMPKTVMVSVYSLWGVGTSILEYPELSAGMQPWQPAINGAVALIRVMGYISFLRGFMVLAKSTQQGAQPGTRGKGLLHIAGGLLAINLLGTISVIQRSFGLT